MVASNDVLVTGCVSSINGGHGFALGTACTIKSSLAYDNGGAGITTGGVNSLTVIDCNSHFNTGFGIAGPKRSLITASTAAENRQGGISVGASSTVSNCNVSGNVGAGILASAGSSVTGCTVAENAGDGIAVDTLCHVTGNTCQGNGAGDVDGAGVHATGAMNRISGNMATGNDRGIDIDSNGNLVVQNDASQNTTNFDIDPGNANAKVESPGSNFVGNRPWANFSH